MGISVQIIAVYGGSMRCTLLMFGLVFFVLTMIFKAPYSHAQTEFTIGVEDTKTFPIYEVRDGEYVGVARDILDLFAQNYGYQFTYTPLPIKRLFYDFLGGRLDFKFPDNKFWKFGDKKASGKKIIYNQEGVIFVHDVMLTRKSNLSKDMSYLKKMAIVRGVTPTRYNALIKKGQLELVEYSSVHAIIVSAMTGRVDGAHTWSEIAHYYLAKIKKEKWFNKEANQVEMVSDTRFFDKHEGVFYLSTIKHPEVIKNFDDFRVKYQSQIIAIKNKYHLKK